MSRVLRVLLAVLALAAGTASAFIPVSGLWLNANEAAAPGRGFTVAVQDKTLLVTSYIYDTGGGAEWYVLSGSLTSGAGVLSATGSLDRFRNGACFSCPYKPAVYVGSAGTATVRFTSATTGTIFWPDGSSLAIVPFDFGYGAAPGGLLGEWVILYDASGRDDAIRYKFTDVLPATANGSGVVRDPDKFVLCEQQVRGANAGSILCVDYDSSGTKPEKQFAFDRWFGDEMDGAYVASSVSQTSARAWRTVSRSDKSTGLLRADIPVSGLWLNSSEAGAPGRGFTIAVQDRTLLMTSYIYDSGGGAEWYVLSGSLSSTSSGLISATGSLDRFRNGACFNCPYKPAVYVGSAGIASVRFDSATTGTIYWPDGSTLRIIPFDFGWGSMPTGMLGEWVMVRQVGSTDVPYRFKFTEPVYMIPPSVRDPATDAYCIPDTRTGFMNCIDPASAQNPEYRFRFEKWFGDQMEGYFVYQGTETPARAFRIVSRSELSIGLKAAEGHVPVATADRIDAMRGWVDELHSRVIP